MFGVMDSSTHEHEISAARLGGRVGNGMCQTSGERKDDEEDSEDKERIFEHDCRSWVERVSRYILDTTKERLGERECRKNNSSRVL